MNKNILAFALVAMFGLAMAVGPASSWTAGNDYGPYTVSAPSTPVTAGHIYEGNISSTVSTHKWAALFGNVTGSIVLADDPADTNNVFYTWTWDVGNGGEVCVSTGSSPSWSSLAAGTAARVDALWSFTASDTDSATNTATATCNMDVASTSISTAAAIDPNGTNAGTEDTCILSTQAGSEDGKDDFVFCTPMANTQTIFGGNWNFQLMVPTPEQADGAGTETYYFFVELD